MKKPEIKKLLTDKTMCISCHQCEIVCSQFHFNGEVNPRRSRIRILENNFIGVSEPIVCRQCLKPACVAACPSGAITKDETLGRVMIAPHKCNGCLECLKGCPFHAIFIDERTQQPLVCDLCGGKPMCAQFCHIHPAHPYAAINFATPSEMAVIKTQTT
ncbi:MAG: 4Fe-4S dicluster domain-containing protein [Dehalococcoidales bacterium]|nr:4Fe-4S dicluster domain-containing protein [Dehalococcoidales bacterium]